MRPGITERNGEPMIRLILCGLLVLSFFQQCESTSLVASSHVANQPTFADYCKDKTEPAIQKTVKALLQNAGTQDCDEAEAILLKQSGYYVSGEGLSDLIPLVPLVSDNSQREQPGALLSLSPHGSTTLYNLPRTNDLIISDCEALENVYINNQVDLPDSQKVWVVLDGCLRFKNMNEMFAAYSRNLSSLWIFGTNAKSIKLPKQSDKLHEVDIKNAPALEKIYWPESSQLANVYIYNSKISTLAGLEENANLTDLYIRGSALSDISKLAKLGFLEKLSVTESNLEDISVVSQLTRLEEVNFRNNRLVAIPDMSRNKNLTSIELVGNSIRDFSPLASLKEIQNLAYDQIGGVDPEIGRAKIRVLEIGNAKKTHSALNMPELWLLTLHNPLVGEIPRFEDANMKVRLVFDAVKPNSIPQFQSTNVQIEVRFNSVPVDNSVLARIPVNTGSLSIRGGHIPSGLDFRRFKSLSKLVLEHDGLPISLEKDAIPKENLKSLTLDGISTRNIDFAAFPNLLYVALNNNRINNITINTFPSSLKSLTLDNNPIVNVSALASYPNLTHISLSDLTLGTIVPAEESNCPIASSNEKLNSACRNLARRKSKYSHHCKWDKRPGAVATIKKINAALSIENCENSDAIVNDASYIDLSGSDIEDISPLKYLYGLRYANLSFNRIKNVTPLRYLTQLKQVLLEKNDISSIDPLTETFFNMERIDLSGNNIVSVAPLANMPNLFDVDISNNKIKSLTPLANLTKMRGLSLYDNKIESLAPLAKMFELDPALFLMGGNPLGNDIPRNEENCPTKDVPVAVSEWCQKEKE